MKTTVNVNLGGQPFIMDEDAFQHLSKYLKLLKVHFDKTEGSTEILTDIESRMAELISAELNGRSIATQEDVSKAISVMGTPEDLGAEADWEEVTQEHESKGKQQRTGNYKTGKRFYRDPDNAIISGTCSGLAAYFGISDPLWVRIAFVILLFAYGSTLIVYIVLWAITPEAKSAKERLLMHGERIDVDAISKKVREEFEKMEKQINDLSDNFKSKKTKE
ncbi:MAG: PspC domain-containing protein [Saprospirales bacterium]|nr:MAG: PspC domain-containing protein [Saprospirales bacterium]